MSLSVLSIDSWESDQAGSDQLTSEQADLKFMRKFNRQVLNQSSQSETLSTYKGSDVSSVSQNDAQVVRRISTQ